MTKFHLQFSIGVWVEKYGVVANAIEEYKSELHSRVEALNRLDNCS